MDFRVCVNEVTRELETFFVWEIENVAPRLT